MNFNSVGLGDQLACSPLSSISAPWVTPYCWDISPKSSQLPPLLSGSGCPLPPWGTIPPLLSLLCLPRLSLEKPCSGTLGGSRLPPQGSPGCAMGALSLRKRNAGNQIGQQIGKLFSVSSTIVSETLLTGL